MPRPRNTPLPSATLLSVPKTVRRSLGCLILLCLPLHAQQIRRRLPHFRHQAQSIGNRSRVHVNRLVTESGTIEMEAGISFAEFAGITNPILLKYTAAGDSLLLGRTEFSVGFDYAHASNDITLAATSLLYDGEHWNVALAPTLTIVRQDGSGIRAGATMITRYDHGPASFGATATWSKASLPGPGTPADLASFGLGGGVRLAAAGWRSRLTLNGNALSEHASATRAATSTFEGIEWEITKRAALNFVVQQSDWRGPSRDNIFLAGLTINLGRIR